MGHAIWLTSYALTLMLSIALASQNEVVKGRNGKGNYKIFMITCDHEAE